MINNVKIPLNQILENPDAPIITAQRLYFSELGYQQGYVYAHVFARDTPFDLTQDQLGLRIATGFQRVSRAHAPIDYLASREVSRAVVPRAASEGVYAAFLLELPDVASLHADEARAFPYSYYAPPGEGSTVGTARRSRGTELTARSTFAHVKDQTHRWFVFGSIRDIARLSVHPSTMNATFHMCLEHKGVVLVTPLRWERIYTELCPFTVDAHMDHADRYHMRCTRCPSRGLECQNMWAYALVAAGMRDLYSAHKDTLDAWFRDPVEAVADALEGWETRVNVRDDDGSPRGVHERHPLLSQTHRLNTIGRTNNYHVYPRFQDQEVIVQDAHDMEDTPPRYFWVSPEWFSLGSRLSSIQNTYLVNAFDMSRRVFEKERRERKARAQKAAASRKFKREECASCIFREELSFADAACARYRGYSPCIGAVPDVTSVLRELLGCEFSSDEHFAKKREELAVAYAYHRYVCKHFPEKLKSGNTLYVVAGPWPDRNGVDLWTIEDGSQKRRSSKDLPCGRDVGRTGFTWAELIAYLESYFGVTPEDLDLWPHEKIVDTYKNEATDETLAFFRWAMQPTAPRRELSSYSWVYSGTHSYRVYGPQTRGPRVRLYTYKPSQEITVHSIQAMRAQSGRDRALAWYV